MALPESLRPLLEPTAYPHPCADIRLIETHISWVLLTGDYAYKLKKPVRFNFVDFSTLERRHWFCTEEARCNRAFAPELYLGVAAVVDRGHGAELRLDASEERATEERAPEAQGKTAPDGRAREQDAPVLEWAVRMRQFDPELALDRLLERGELGASLLHAFGLDLAVLHAALPRLAASTPDAIERRVYGPVEDNFAEIRRTGLSARFGPLLDTAKQLATEAGSRLSGHFQARLAAGSLRECHGDLHLSNLALIQGRVTAFDCLEFNEDLRWIDTMSDVAFLFMDCLIRGRADLAYPFLDGYLDRSGDYRGVRALHYFTAYRSVVRAKVAALRWEQTGEEDAAGRFRQHLGWAQDWLSRPPAGIVLTCGLSGSGKSRLAGELLGELPALRLRSDVARKSLAGLEALAESGSALDAGLYDPAQSDRTFAFLAELVRDLVLVGEWVIVDATFIERARREPFRALAAELGVPFHLLYCDAPLPLLRQRVRTRSHAGGDPSEADEAVLDAQLARFEPPGSDESVIRVDTSKPLSAADRTALVAALNR